MRRRLAHAALAYIAAFAIIAGFKPFLDWREWRAREAERTAPVYAPVTQIEVARMPGALVVRGVSRKLADCVVPAGAHVLLVARSGPFDAPSLHAYPARRADGAKVFGAPLVAPGGAFVVGPWRIEDADAALAALTALVVRLPCEFPSGVRRMAEIGPIPLNGD